MRILSGARRGTIARARSPRTEGNPSRSRLTTATVSLSARKTMARAVNSPCLDLAGDGVPIPPLTGSRGSGVMIRRATPASNAGLADWAYAPYSDIRQREMEEKRLRIMFVPADSLVQSQGWWPDVHHCRHFPRRRFDRPGSVRKPT